MSPELTPNVGAVLRCIRESLEIWIAPALQGQAELSYVTTATHLLSYVERRIEMEGPLLFEEIAYLRKLLPTALDWLAQRPDCAELSSGLTRTLGQVRDPEIYPSLNLLADEVAVLRQHVCDVLEQIHREDPVRLAESGGDALHQSLRDYIAWQLELEGRIVEPAFRGRGPRR